MAVLTGIKGWLEGHIREQNYGADWGDYVSFVKQMRQKARDLDVDLLVVDTGVSCNESFLRVILIRSRIFTMVQALVMLPESLVTAVLTVNCLTPSSSSWTMTC